MLQLIKRVEKTFGFGFTCNVIQKSDTTIAASRLAISDAKMPKKPISSASPMTDKTLAEFGSTKTVKNRMKSKQNENAANATPGNATRYA